jgi:hypothetical protein
MKERPKLDPRLKRERKADKDRLFDTRVFERRNVHRGFDPWPSYERDVSRYVEHFATIFPDAAHVPIRLRERKKEGHKTLVVDLCGAADAASIGADHTISLTLNAFSSISPHPHQTLIAGDIFKSGTIGKIIHQVDKHGGQIDCVFMRPDMGLAAFAESMRAHLRLYSGIARLYPHLVHGGDMYMELYKFKGLSVVKDVLNMQSPVTLCETAVVSGTYYGAKPESYIYIRKPEGAPDRLMTIEELRSLPGLEERFKSFFVSPES